MSTFKGSYDWIHRWEGHNGSPYVPGGSKAKHSGITFDPGADLGHINTRLFERHYFPLLTREQQSIVKRAYGLRGRPAYNFLQQNKKEFGAMRMSKDDAVERFPLVAAPYWQGAAKRFTGLERDDTPSSVHTALLSLCYNRGVWNRWLEVLEAKVKTRDWKSLGETIMSMQQDHQYSGIRKRRRAEGELILDELNKKETKWEKWQKIPPAPLEPRSLEKL